MELLPLGKTTLPVTKIGLGLAALGRPGYINLGHQDDLPSGPTVVAMEKHSHAVLDAAYAAGIRYFDAARSYGRAESFISTWLGKKGLRPGKISLGSKWGYTYTAQWKVDVSVHEVKDHSLPQLIRQWTESRTLLGQHLGLYQIHSATLETGVLEDTEVLNYLAHLKREGVIVGLSLSGPRQQDTLRKAMEVSIDGEPLFQAVQASWNLMEPSVGPALAEAKAAGWGVIVKEALANGRLTDRNQEPDFAPQQEILRELAHKLEVGIDSIALAAVLSQPWCDVVLSGVASLSHLQSNLAALKVTWQKDYLEKLAPLVQSPEDYWTFRKQMAWN
ncbi:MAG: aldo/keto reductase [Bacteroidota bacterium]